jgi:hypothetical protein
LPLLSNTHSHSTSSFFPFPFPYQATAVIANFVEAIIFGLFVTVMMWDQLSAVWDQAKQSVFDFDADAKRRAKERASVTLRLSEMDEDVATDADKDNDKAAVFGDAQSDRKACRWCHCSCDVQLGSLHSAHANLTINMQLQILHQ